MESAGSQLPPLTAVVLNFNGGTMVLECIRTVLEQEPCPSEVLCVDNGSTDGSDHQIEERFPGVRLIRLPRNVGYAGGMNRGIEAASGELIATLNLDLTLDRSYLRLCAEALDRDPRLGGVTGKLLRPNGMDPPIIDSTGHVVYRNRRAVDRGELEPDVGQYDSMRGLFGVCGAAPVYRRRMLDDIVIGGEWFDEEFFAYFEDFDLSWRAQLRGWRFGFVPEAMGTHHRGATGGKASTFILACNHRNRLLVMLRNDHPISFLKALPGIAYTELRATLHMLYLRPSALVLAWLQFFRLLPGQLRKRRQIQSRRTVGYRELDSWFEPYDYGIRATLRRRAARASRAG
ncbi:MAG TPA: glycosyltransferase family 2 protein [Actinomycetota bacterium]|nr:glycosyltransferase family 2 protein [Actinomycetota bacterium]